MMTTFTHVDNALQRWDSLRHTRALRAVDATRVAAEADRAPDGRLHGLLFSVKDLFPVAGVESCAGSLLLAGNVPVCDPPLIAALRGAGATVFGKGVCPEFGFGVDTENRLDGRVRHHGDPAISPGGSSGGDAVAVGAGVVDFALAGDYGGSVRWPAQAAGVLGLRFGVGRAIATGRLGAPSSGLQARLEVPGVLAADPGVLRGVVDVLLGPATIRPVRRLVLPDPELLGPLSPPVATAIEEFAARAARRGYAVVDAPAGLTAALAAAFEVYRRLRELTDTHDGVRALAIGRDELLADSTRAVLAAAAESTAGADRGEVAALQARAAELGRTVRAALIGADAIALPVAASGAIGFGARVDIGGTTHDATGLHAHLRAVSLTGQPALAVPVAERIAVQLVGADGAEQLLCAIAEGVRR
jgi:amidase